MSEPAWRDQLFLEIAREKLRDQASKLEQIRSSAGVLLGAVTVMVGLLVQALTERAVGQPGVLGLLSLALSLLALLGVLWPRTKWGAGLRPRVLMESYRDSSVPDKAVLDKILESLAQQVETNDARFAHIFNANRAAIVLLLLGSLLVIYQGGLWSP